MIHLLIQLTANQRFSFWRKSHGTLKAGWSISGGKGCHLLQKEVFRQKEKRCSQHSHAVVGVGMGRWGITVQ
jgi:hypothetical protein